MPPRRGIVKSGNAGNSSKATPKDAKDGSSSTNANEPSKEKPLFPPGSKYPLSLLNERCQKNEWKANVDVRQQQGGFSFVVVLHRTNKKTSERESVRLEPHPPKLLPTALEAKHWGATYGLYRFSNSLQLNRVLPPGPREYWNELVEEQKTAPSHMDWMWNADPFAARREVAERQEKAAKRQEVASSSHDGGDRQRTTNVTSEFSNVPEVRMAPSLRDLVEVSIKKTIAALPDALGPAESTIALEEHENIIKQLEQLGFKPPQARRALKFFTEPSAMTKTLLHAKPPLDAVIEWLILDVPECDLPKRFLPSQNSYNPFVTSMHGGSEDLKTRWIQDEAVKAGWPAYAVKECLAEERFRQSWPLLLRALGNKLLGLDWVDIPELGEDPQVSIEEEGELLRALYPDATLGTTPNEIVVPLSFAPVSLHAMLPSQVIDGYPPALYLTSRTVPAYIRLYMISSVLQAIKDGELVDEGSGIALAAIDHLDQAWSGIEQDGPPNIATVMHHLLPPPPEEAKTIDEDAQVSIGRSGRRPKNMFLGRRPDNRTHTQVKADFEKVTSKPAYQELYQTRQKLPSFAARTRFLEMLDHNRVVVVVGETGCGKTTQLPQFILDSLIAAGKGADANIVITQPRRLSAISVAARVAAERLEDGSVGYAIRGESKQDHRTKLLFCTTGVVLRRLSGGEGLKDVTHVIVDEVHERSVDGDFLLLELKDLLTTHPRLKVVLMSATINHETFVKYFNNAPLLSIPGRSPHPITNLYLEDILPTIDYKPTASKSTQKESAKDQAAFRAEYQAKGLKSDTILVLQSIVRSERVDYQLIAAVVSHIVATATSSSEAILIFLHGVQEIRQCIDAVRSVLPSGKADLYPLHANLSNEEQRRVFTKSSSRWKVVVATNVAETSITIDDVVHVIDAGKVKEIRYDPDAGLTRLVETWVSQAGARQRRGRAGRTQPGTCYKLYTKKQEGHLAQFPIPEILRTPLENICLTVKASRESVDVKSFLSRAVDPPNVHSMDRAWSVLQDLGAIDEDDQLTALGRHMSVIPVDLRLSKMLILATILRCISPILTVAACLSSKPLFLNPLEKRDEATRARAAFSTANSDLLTDVNAYDRCVRMHTEGTPQNVIRIFFQDNFISPTTVRDITSLRSDFLSALVDLGFVPFGTSSTDSALNANSSNDNVVKAVIAGGLWPRVARVSLPKSAIKFDKVQAGTIQRENEAREYKIWDDLNLPVTVAGGSGGSGPPGGGPSSRVFIHPGSVLFSSPSNKSPFLAYFSKNLTTKVFLRDATEVPIYGLLLFGGQVAANHIAGGLTVRSRDGLIKLKAWPRIGVLVNQLRRLLDAELQQAIEQGSLITGVQSSPVLKAMIALLTNDGLTGF